MKLEIGPYTIHIFRHNQTLAERAKKHYKKMIAEGRCTSCGRKTRKNPHKGHKNKYYRQCTRCRKHANELSLKRYYAKKA